MGVVATAVALFLFLLCMYANGEDSLLKQIQNMGFRRGGAIANSREEKSHAVLPSFLPSFLSPFTRSIFSWLIHPENRRAFAKEARPRLAGQKRETNFD